MKILVKLVPLAFGVALIAFAFGATEEGSFADRVVDQGVSEFIDHFTSSDNAQDSERVQLVERDAAAVAGWLASGPEGGRPARLDHARVKRRGGPGLAEENHLEEYTRTEQGFRLCVRNVAGAWATWVAGPRRNGLAGSGVMGDCSYRAR